VASVCYLWRLLVRVVHTFCFFFPELWREKIRATFIQILFFTLSPDAARAQITTHTRR
jgi:hypothetical protein